MSRGPDPKVSDKELIEIVATCEERIGRPITTTKEIADLVGLARQNIHRRLEQLQQEERVQKYKPGRSAVYWVDESCSDDK